MKLTLFFGSIFIASCLNAQNVGVGTTTPTERLDVNGNLNVAGNIKIAGTSGQSGQVLMTNGTGATTWGDLCSYQNKATFTGAGSGSWTAPAGVTKALVEIWGAGGGGNVHGGGGSGGYIQARVDVTPGTTYNFSIGLGGSGATTATANSGVSTSITFGSVVLTANGGSGATYFSATNGNPGTGGSWSATAGFTNFIASLGQQGQPIDKTYVRLDGTTFHTKHSFGRGGDAPGALTATGGNGVAYSFVSGTTTLVEYRGGGNGRQPGGGGGNGMSATGTSVTGYFGGSGMIVIHY